MHDVGPEGDQSAEMTEALQLLAQADFESGSTERRIAALTEARRRIWEIADRAGEDSVAIRGLTRGLEKTEELLVEGPPWSDPPAGERAGG